MKILKNIIPEEIGEYIKRPSALNISISENVKQIMNAVILDGDEALRRFTKKFDKRDISSLEIRTGEMEEAKAAVSQEFKNAIGLAIKNIEGFHKAQMPKDIDYETSPGILCRLKYLPLETVGIYVPGGTAPLISTLLMLAVPATVAGCKNLIVCTPPEPTKELLYALSLFNLKAFRIGGAQAIAAMSFGTKTIPKVDKLFGPGNQYVTEAKIQASSKGMPIDIPAGPSELLIIADNSAIPEYLAMDLLSQAEHGEDSQVILIATTEEIITATLDHLENFLNDLPRKDIARKSIQNSFAILTNTIEEAIELSNQYSPEHLLLSVSNSDFYAKKVRNAGSVFLGNYSPESAGDYSSGTNHTLPTGGFARNWSGVTILSFLKTITYQKLSRQGLSDISQSIINLARAEGLDAHARAVELRIQSK